MVGDGELWWLRCAWSNAPAETAALGTGWHAANAVAKMGCAMPSNSRWCDVASRVESHASLPVAVFTYTALMDLSSDLETSCNVPMVVDAGTRQKALIWSIPRIDCGEISAHDQIGEMDHPWSSD